MPRFGRVLVGVLVIIGLPAVVAGQWRAFVLAHPGKAVIIALVWEAVLGVAFLLTKMAAEPASRRLEQMGSGLDRALVRRVSPYGRHYRQWVLDSRRFMEAKGLATVGDFTPELDEVFVDVSLVPRAPHQVTGGMLADAPVDATQRYSIWDFLDRGGPVVLAVIGAPGSGKTTLLSHIARKVARTRRRHPRSIPVLLQLRDHARQVALDPKVTLPQLLREAVPALAVTEPSGWWESQLQHGRCVVLLDGLDEVASSEERREITGWINGLISVYSRNDYVITSRPHGYRAAVIESAKALQVRPFTNSQVRGFLLGWYLAVERRATGDPSGREVEMLAQESANDLLDRLAASPALYELTINPLLLTMIANVHRYRGSLPGSRADLYGEVCQVILWRRLEAKKLAVELSGVAKERLLARLAFLMMRQRARDLPRQEALEAIRPWLKRMSTSVTAGDFLSDVGSNGLLVERERNLYAFAHLTFQEYLAAKHIQDHNLAQVLADAVDDPWWRETTLLYVAGADADPIVRAGLAVGSPTALSLAFECSETSAELAPDLREHFQRVLRSAFEPKTDPEHRRLIAGILAARHFRALVQVSTGTLVCPRPVAENLYWLFLEDGGAPRPEGPVGADPDATRPVSGVWSGDAEAFVAWLNAVTGGTGGALYRLPSVDELEELAAKPGPGAQLLVSSVTSAWATADDRLTPVLWTAPGRTSPRTVLRADVLAAATADIADSGLVVRLLALSIRALGRALSQVTVPALEEASTIATVLSGARSGVHAANPFRDLSSAHDHARLLIQYLALARELAATLEKAVGKSPSLDVTVADELAGYLTRFPYRDLARDLSRASSLDRDFAIAMDWHQDMGLAHARDHADAVYRSLTRARALLAMVERTPRRPGELDEALALDRVPAPDAEVEIRLGPLLRDVMGSALATALSTVLHHDDDRADVLAAAFAETVVVTAHPHAGEVTVNLDGLSRTAVRACGMLPRSGPAARWTGTVAARLASAVGPVLATRGAPSAEAGRRIRIPALALAVEADRRRWYDLGDLFRGVAAGVTLLGTRADHPAALENLVLARA